MVLPIQKELMKRLSTLKIPKVFTLLNAITTEHEHDLIINVIGCWWIEEKNNVMTNPVMRYLG
jgi:hypothetical protein